MILDPLRTLILPLGNAVLDENGHELVPAGRHTKLISLNSGLQVLWWNSASEREQLPSLVDQLVDPQGVTRNDPPIELLVTLGSNTFRGHTKPQAIVQARIA